MKNFPGTRRSWFTQLAGVLPALLVATSPSSRAVDIPLGTTGHDTFIDSRTDAPGGDQTGVNHGTAGSLVVRHTDHSHNNHVVGLLRFDLTGAPATDVTRVWLHLTIDPSGTGGDAAAMVALHPVTGPWTESSVTWNSRPAWNGSAIDATRVHNTPGTSYRWDITPLYLGWMAATVPNHGISLLSWDANGEGVRFVSSEGSADPGLRPRLSVETGPAGPVPGGSYVLHELNDGFQGTDYAGRPGIWTQALFETTNVTLGPGTLNGSFTSSDAIRMVQEFFSDRSRGVPDPQAGWPNPDQDHVWQNQLHMQLSSHTQPFTGTFHLGEDGVFWTYTDGEIVPYQVSPSGNALVSYGIERDASSYAMGVAVGVKKPTALNASSVAGDWVIAETGRSFEGPQSMPPGPPEHAWGATEGIMAALFQVTLDGAGTVSGNGPEVMMKRTLSEQFIVQHGPSPMTTPPWDYQDTQSWSQLDFNTTNEGEPWAGTYTVSPDGTLVMTLDDDGDEEIITYNVAADGDVMILGEVLPNTFFIEGILGVGVRKPAAMTPADVQGDWFTAIWECSFHGGGPPETDHQNRSNRQVLGSRAWLSLRADGSFLYREEFHDLNQFLSNDLIGLSGESVDGSLDADNIVRNHADLHIAGPTEGFADGTWTVTPDGLLTMFFIEDGETGSLELHVAANGEVAVLSASAHEVGYSGTEFMVAIKQPASAPSDLGPPKLVGTSGAPAIELPLLGSASKHASRIMSLGPDGTWQDRGFTTKGGTLVIPPDELQQHPVQLFRIGE